jgi:hypothetical protein
MAKGFSFYGRQAVLNTSNWTSKSLLEITKAELFRTVTLKFLDHLRERKSAFLDIFPDGMGKKEQGRSILKLLDKLSVKTREEIISESPEFRGFFRDIYMMDQFVENLYNYWRSFERYLISYSEHFSSPHAEDRPYRVFNQTIEKLNHLVRKVYRDIRENITGEHCNIYRQIPAGCSVGLIVTKRRWPCPPDYNVTAGVPFVKQVLIEPPLIIDPPMNKRAGEFRKVGTNPIDGLSINSDEWLCYPAKVGNLIIHVFFHMKFIGLGASLANLFDLARDEDLARKPDAIYVFGAPSAHLKKYGKRPTVFYDDAENGIVVGAVPDDDEYGYFGYLKKMVLTLHNVVVLKKGRLPVHGAMVRITLKNGKSANVVIWGDTGAGKSESIEAFRMLSSDYIRDMSVIFDDMGSLDMTPEGEVRAYGTETGAFVRLDDLQPGFAFGNIDRSIIMSPQKINARAVLPITTIEEVTAGYPVHFLLYANNYEDVGKSRPILERFESVTEAFKVFREGKRMAKGTTAENGLVTSYFANIFGPVQFRELYDRLAKKTFKTVFDSGAFVGQLRTMIGIPGYETKGPENAAKELFSAISKA